MIPETPDILNPMRTLLDRIQHPALERSTMIETANRNDLRMLYNAVENSIQFPDGQEVIR